MIQKQTFQQNILTWYQRNQRVLPWRNDVTPYRVWISEIMLQQTRVETVIPYFERFIDTLPTIEDLAKVSDDVLHKLWEGLGYYSRARNLKKAAIIIMEQYQGILPNQHEQLLKLPGIGPYTAGAIMSIAYNKQYTAVDGNVLRVFARLLAIKTSIKDVQTKQVIRNTVTNLLPINTSDFNQALMEIGATVCIPNGAPKCEICPLHHHCISYQKNIQHEIPIKQKRISKKTETYTVLVFQYQSKYALEKRSDQGLLASMYQFPLLKDKQDIKNIQDMYNLQKNQITMLPKQSHVFTHKKWELFGFHILLQQPAKDYQFYTTKQIKQELPIPTAFSYYKNEVIK